LTRTGQFPGMSCLLLRADGVGWGWWDHCAGGWDLSFLLFLLDVILNQNPIIINSTNLFTGEWIRDKEMWWQLETLIEASDNAWARPKMEKSGFLINSIRQD
jgi:hypothetical protein